MDRAPFSSIRPLFGPVVLERGVLVYAAADLVLADERPVKSVRDVGRRRIWPWHPANSVEVHR